MENTKLNSCGISRFETGTVRNTLEYLNLIRTFQRQNLDVSELLKQDLKPLIQKEEKELEIIVENCKMLVKNDFIKISGVDLFDKIYSLYELRDNLSRAFTILETIKESLSLQNKSQEKDITKFEKIFARCQKISEKVVLKMKLRKEKLDEQYSRYFEKEKEYDALFNSKN